MNDVIYRVGFGSPFIIPGYSIGGPSKVGQYISITGISLQTEESTTCFIRKFIKDYSVYLKNGCFEITNSFENLDMDRFNHDFDVWGSDVISKFCYQCGKFKKEKR